MTSALLVPQNVKTPERYMASENVAVIPRKPARSTFHVVWLAPDELQVDHLVVARDADEARRISAGELRNAVGERFGRWRLRTAC